MKHALWLPVLVCALCAHARAAPRVAAADRAHAEGSLVTRQGGKIVDVPLEHTEVAIRVDGPLAEATVTQRFKNPYGAKIEAVYLFPLPTSAAVGALTISSGGRTIRGTIQERAKATQRYVAAREQGLVAALLAQERPNLFTQSVANLEPAATVEVTLTYVQRLPYEDGGYELVFPMAAGHDIGLRVDLGAGVPIEAIESPSHRIAIERPPGAPALAAVKLRSADTIPNKDFVLRYRAAGAAPRFGVLTHRAGGTGSFMLLAQPPAAPAAPQIAPREIIFALDTSSSMRGLPLAKAKDVIRRILRGLSADDTFQLVRFADRASPLASAPIANKPRNVELVLDWLAALDAGGGAETVTGIDAALALPHDPARLRIVVFLTDGYVGDDDEILRRVGAGLHDARLFAFGVGSAVNRYLLEELAAIGRGAAQFVRPDEDSAAAVDAFERRIAAPVLTDLRVDWGGLAVSDVSPRAIPDLFAGQPLVLAGHYAAPGAGVITVRGKQAGRDVAFQVPVKLPVLDAGRPAVAAVWARQRIAELSRQLVRAANPALEREVLALALEHRLLTPYTAFVAIDESRATAGGAPRRAAVPVEIPEGVRGILDGSASGYAYYPSYGFAARGLGLRDSVADLTNPFRSEAPGPDRFPGPDPYGGGTGRIGIGTGRFAGGDGDRGGAAGALGGAAADPERTVAEIVASRARSPALAPARRMARATFTIPAPIVEGGEGALEIIRRYVRRHQSQLTDCYERELPAAPGLAGTVTASFTVGESGLVSGATATGLGNARVEACIAQVLGAIELPRLPGGPARARYAFVLNPPPPERP